jgi:hypothetical protein
VFDPEEQWVEHSSIGGQSSDFFYDSQPPQDLFRVSFHEFKLANALI